MRRSLFLSTAVWFFAACADPAPHPDLTGTWEERDAQDRLVSLWSFDANGKFSFDSPPVLSSDDAEHFSGTYQIIDGSELLLDGIVVEDRQHQRTQRSFYADSEFFAPDAFLADEPQPDLHGSWHNNATVEAFDQSGQLSFHDHRTQDLELRPDGQLRLVQQIEGETPSEITGRHEPLGADRHQITLELPAASISFTYQLVNGEALAVRVYRRKNSTPVAP